MPAGLLLRGWWATACQGVPREPAKAEASERGGVHWLQEDITGFFFTVLSPGPAAHLQPPQVCKRELQPRGLWALGPGMREDTVLVSSLQF